jgi:two-component system KDP operon response regulator KdpE
MIFPVTRFEFGELEIDVAAHVVKRSGEIIKLTSTEYNLLMLMLVQNEGRVLTHQFLLKEIWGVGLSN